MSTHREHIEENKTLRFELDSLSALKDVLRDVLSGDADQDTHSYITCSDDDAPNFYRGCPRCIILQFVRSS